MKKIGKTLDMKNKISYSMLMNNMILIIPLFFHIYDQGYAFNYFQYIPFILIIIIYLFDDKKRTLNRNNKILYLKLLSLYLILPFLTFNIGQVNMISGISYILLNLIYISSILIISMYSNKENFMLMLKKFIIGNSIGLIFALLTHLNQINMNNLSWILGGARISRADFGMSHPNFAGAFLFANIIALYLYNKFSKEKNKTIYFLIVFFNIMLVFTGSRTAIMIQILFYFLDQLLYALRKINKYLRQSIYFLLGIFILLSLIYNINIDIGIDLNSIEDRFSNLIWNLKLLESKNRILIGIGPINIRSLVQYLDGMKVSDNWYITTIVTHGLIGLIIMIRIIISTMKNIIKNKNITMGIFFICICIYALFENVLFVPGVLLSFFTWFIVFLSLKNTNLGG